MLHPKAGWDVPAGTIAKSSKKESSGFEGGFKAPGGVAGEEMRSGKDVGLEKKNASREESLKSLFYSARSKSKEIERRRSVGGSERKSCLRSQHLTPSNTSLAQL